MVTPSEINTNLQNSISEVIDNSYKLNGAADGMFNNDQIDRGGRAVPLGTQTDINMGSEQAIDNTTVPNAPILGQLPNPVPGLEQEKK